jgi:hypothetical protein
LPGKDHPAAIKKSFTIEQNCVSFLYSKYPSSNFFIQFMKSIICSLLLMIPVLVSGQTNYKSVHRDNGYKHYSNHKDQTHYKPQGNSYKPTPTKITATTAPVKKTEPVVVKTSDAVSSNALVPLELVYSTIIISSDTLKNLKAVIVSGDVDGINGVSTLNYIKGMKELAEFLRSAGVSVQEFYCPNDNWDNIKAASANANFFVYSGHGVYDGTLPPKWVGGLYLTDKFVSSDEIQQGLMLARNSVVVFNHACFTAGSSAVDKNDIGVVEAHRRVAMYAHPYIDSGLGCYYANNFNGGAKFFFQGFLSGNTVNDIYINTTSPWSKVLEYRDYEFNKKYKIGVSVYNPDSYDVAIVSNPRLTIYDLINNQIVKK